MGKWSVERWVVVAGTIGSLGAFVFSAGMTWSKVIEQEANQKAFEYAVSSTYLRTDVYAADQRRLSESVDRLTRALETLQGQQLMTTGSASLHGRMFDK